MDREAFLTTVRQAVGRARLPSLPEGDPGLLVPDLPHEDLAERFATALHQADGIVHTGDPVEIVLDVARRLETNRYIAWADEHLSVPGLSAALADAGLTPVSYTHAHDDEGRHRRQEDYQDLVLGITGTEAGFAETGTVVVRSGPRRPRMASLIPTVHVALLARSDIHRSLAHWAAGAAESMGTDTNVVFISGPSRTGDIEMRLNKGVHGPKEVHVILL